MSFAHAEPPPPSGDLPTANTLAASGTGVVGEHGEIPWSGVETDIRLAQLGRLFVARAIETRIHNVLDATRRARTIYPEPRNVVVHGETGVGKTDIMKRYLAANPEFRRENGCIKRPVLYVDVRHSSTPKSVARSMLRSLGVEEGYCFGATAELTQRLKVQLVGQNVELVIMDEFHNTVTDNGAVKANRIAAWVKDLSKAKIRIGLLPDGQPEENIPFAMIGTERVLRIVEPTENPELASITPYDLAVDRYRYRTKAEIAEFRDFLDDLDQELPFDEFSDLGRPALADKLHIATFGLLRQVAILITGAAELAILDGSGRIREAHLHDAMEDRRGLLQANLISAESQGAERRAVVNPFEKPILGVTNRRVRKSGHREAA